jgi:hypothetical protein
MKLQCGRRISVRTSLDDLAADVAELDQHYAAAVQRVADLNALFTAAVDVQNRLYRLRQGFGDLVEVHRELPTLMADAIALKRYLDSIPF